MRIRAHFFVARPRSIAHIDRVAGNEAGGKKTKANMNTTTIDENMNTIRITAHAHLGYRPWLARITGSDAKYGFSRDFLESYVYSRSRSGLSVGHAWEIADTGLYQLGESKHDNTLFVVWVKEGRLVKTTVDMARAKAIASLLDEGKDLETARQATKPTKNT